MKNNAIGALAFLVSCSLLIGCSNQTTAKGNENHEGHKNHVKQENQQRHENHDSDEGLGTKISRRLCKKILIIIFKNGMMKSLWEEYKNCCS